MGELGFGEEVGEEFHRVGAQARYVVVAMRSAAGAGVGAGAGAGVGGGGGGVGLGVGGATQGFDFFLHEFCYGGADFEAEEEGVGHFWGEGEEEAAEAAADVCYFYLFRHFWFGGFLLGVGVRCRCARVLFRFLYECWIMQGPIHCLR